MTRLLESGECQLVEFARLLRGWAVCSELSVIELGRVTVAPGDRLLAPMTVAVNLSRGLSTSIVIKRTIPMGMQPVRGAAPTSSARTF